jgi:membrane-bound lytic murein transglycosylase F
MQMTRLIFCGLIFFVLSCERDEDVAIAPINVTTKDKPIVLDAKPRRFPINDRIQSKINQYEATVKLQAKRYGFDWRLIMALIRQESQFNEQARSRVGAKGLMQIMPGTISEIQSDLDIEYISQNPKENIKAGVYHLFKQYESLTMIKDKGERIKFALAAYNAGIARVLDGITLSQTLYGKELNWDNLAKALHRLKPSFWKDHLLAWENGKPRYGYFYGANETVPYVNNIMAYYDIYRKFY